MSLLDDARRLANVDPYVADFCFACGEMDDRHYEECLWPLMPKIVAALEAAQELIDLPDARVIVHTDWAEYQALAAALKGEVVPSESPD